MKKFIVYLGIFIVLFGCDNQSTNVKSDEDTLDSHKQNSDTSVSENNLKPSDDTATSNFLIKAAEAGWVEEEAGNKAMAKATTSAVKNFASIIAQDHMKSNEKIRLMAAHRGVNLPLDTPQQKMKIMAKMFQERGKAFDRAYLDMMIKDHQEAIFLFENSKLLVEDEEVKNFIANIIPKLKMHLDSAQSISSRLAR